MWDSGPCHATARPSPLRFDRKKNKKTKNDQRKKGKKHGPKTPPNDARVMKISNIVYKTVKIKQIQLWKYADFQFFFLDKFLKFTYFNI